MNDRELTPADLRQIEQEGLTSPSTEALEKFRQGTTPVKLLKPCTPGTASNARRKGQKTNSSTGMRRLHGLLIS